jgi:uncharacterized damage-inducible protein DinB
MQAAEFARFMATVPAEEQTTRTKARIVALLRENGEEFAHWLESQTPDFPGERVAVEPGKTKTRFEALSRVKEHEIHHRAQLMPIERPAGHCSAYDSRERRARSRGAVAAGRRLIFGDSGLDAILPRTGCWHWARVPAPPH